MQDAHALKILEFDDVKSILAKFAHWELGKASIMEIYPLETFDEITEQQEKVRQLYSIISEDGSLPLNGLKNIRDIVIAATKGVYPAIPDFIDIKRNLDITFQLKTYLAKWTYLPFIHDTLEMLVAIPMLSKAISQTFDDGGHILSSASAELYDIREKIREIEVKIHNRVENILREQSYHKMLQEQVVTEREGRFVIPIKQEYRGVFQGLVLDTSSSGATVFMEPLEIIESNNELRHAKIEEKNEIQRIIKNLTLHVSRHSKDLLSNLEVMAQIDMIGAIGHFMKEYKAVIPEIKSGMTITLKKARHPLLGKKAVPIDIELGKDYNCLIVTGPNTGGKTVTLKTIGLLTLMGLSGLPIPAEEGSGISLFSRIYADIGDEQSITQNLSTFSSHMSQIIRILKDVDGNSLVLLDELGAGTDPKEGTALGIAILEYLGDRGARTVVTTHYGELKYFASTYPLARNAAMEFNSDTLEPSYNIAVGLPGRSCALAIAGRLGIPEEVQKRAEHLVSEDYIAMDRLLQDLEEKGKQMQQEIILREQSRHEAQALKNRYEEELYHVKTEKSEILTQAASEAEILLHSAKGDIKKTLKEFRKKLSDLSKTGKAGKDEKETLANEAFSRLDEILERLESFRKKKSISSQRIKKHEIKPGEEIFIPSMNKHGEIVDVKDDNLLIKVEKIKITLPYWEVKVLSPGEKKKTENMSKSPERQSAFQERLDLRGEYVDEALYKVGKHIDEAVMAEAGSFQIVHGKGTGALRKAIHLYLKKHPAVTQFRLGEIHEGSWGVTVVFLK